MAPYCYFEEAGNTYLQKLEIQNIIPLSRHATNKYQIRFILCDCHSISKVQVAREDCHFVSHREGCDHIVQVMSISPEVATSWRKKQVARLKLPKGRNKVSETVLTLLKVISTTFAVQEVKPFDS